MAFSKRVGMEPASDLKKRISSLCQEAGFVVVGATMNMRREESLEESVRRILTWVHEPNWNPTVPSFLAGTNWEDHKNHQIEIRARIGCDGSYDGTVELLCMATDRVGELDCPTLRDCRIQLQDLPVCLVTVARQMKEVIAARKRGERGPWQLGDMLWKNWNK